MSSANSFPTRFLKVTSKTLVAVVWFSTLVFGLYILAFYAAARFGGDMNQWNELLPDIYSPDTHTANWGIGLHFLGGGIILMLGCIQVLESIRDRYPKLHRILGRIYVVSSIVTAIGGLTFIFVKGTIGGTVMNIGFGLYGVLMLICAIETFRHASQGRFEQHRAWALRLFALAIGSWLYRMEYGFWYLFTDRLWSGPNLQGPFDYFMDFWFYLPNLLVAEVVIGRKKFFQGPWAEGIAALGLLTAIAFLALGTYFFTLHYWWPAIWEWLSNLFTP